MSLIESGAVLSQTQAKVTFFYEVRLLFRAQTFLRPYNNSVRCGIKMFITFHRYRWKKLLLVTGLLYSLVEIVYLWKIIRNYPASFMGYQNTLPVIHLEDYDDDFIQEQITHSMPKQILFWTELLDEDKDTLTEYCFRKHHLENCPYKCDYTTDRSYFELSDAVVFDCRYLKLDNWRTLLVSSNFIAIRFCPIGFMEFKKMSFLSLGWVLGIPKEVLDMPSYRMEHQFWVFLMFDSPIYTWIDLNPFNNLFNWTMTFRHHSDVYIPYGRLVPLKRNGTETRSHKKVKHTSYNPLRSKLPVNYLLNRQLVTWVVSNCKYQQSKRDEFTKELQNYIKVDIYGKCGTLECTKYDGVCEDPLKCYEKIGGKYKFYLAFENSLCEDYITEKFFHSLRVRMVPVVYGYGNYSRVAPKGSYINARAFPSVKALADYLIYLDRNHEEYLKYFQWTETYEVKNVSYFEDAWCSLCRKLWENGNATKRITNLVEWWTQKSDNVKESACVQV